MPVASTRVGGVAADFRRDGGRAPALLDALVGDVLFTVVDTTLASTGRPVLDIVDVGGGTGGLAVPLATRGHNGFRPHAISHSGFEI